MHSAQGGCALCHPCWWEVDLSPSSQHCISETLARFLNSCLKGMSGRIERKVVVLDILVTLPPPLYRQKTPLGVEERWKISTGLLFRRSLCSLRSLANTFFFLWCRVTPIVFVSAKASYFLTCSVFSCVQASFGDQN